MESYWRKKDDRIAMEALANWVAMGQLCEANPFAMNWGSVHPTTPRMRGLHPDYPDPRWKSNQANDLDQN